MDDLRAREKAKILAGGWPYWPALPVKQRKQSMGFPKLGVIVAPTLNKVWLTNIFAYNANPKAALADAKSITYKDLDALLDDGWVGD